MQRHVSFLLATALLHATGGLTLLGGEPSWQPEGTADGDGAERLNGIPHRAPWTTSKITGTPGPPPPFRAERVFTRIRFDKPSVITSAPGTRRLFVAQQFGQIYSLTSDADVARPDLFLDVRELVRDHNQGADKIELEAVYGLTFHPNFQKNRYCYVAYVIRDKPDDGQKRPDGTRVSRFRVTQTEPPRCDPASEQIVITWLQGGHNGGCLKFGPDGCLYISTGDGGGGFPPDPRNSGQDVSNLLSAILRIDVDRTEGDRPYAIPADNPFVGLDGARPEIWAYGLRNVWKMSFDRQTGELWAGDVGWELWEMIYRVRKGENYGWSIVEGRQPIYAERQRGPTPIVPPTIEISHSDGVSVTGGFVYRGKKFPDLFGAYVFGDWATRRIWGVNVDGEQLGPRRDLLEPSLSIVGFCEDHDGELYLLDYLEGTIHQLARNEPLSSTSEFPRRLSQTGLFSSVADHIPAEGVVPFSINAEQWADHTTSQRWIAVPDDARVTFHPGPNRPGGVFVHGTLQFPKDTVLLKTISLDMRRGDPDSRRRLETQILHYDEPWWRGYSYRWNEQQTDAELVDAAGDDRAFTVTDPDEPGGGLVETWHYSSRSQCMQCHTSYTEFANAFSIAQLNRDHDYGGVTENQIRIFRHIGLLADAVPDPDDPFAEGPPKSVQQLPRLADPYDEQTDLNRRARAYLHTNCAHCHTNGGGGSSSLHVGFDTRLSATQALGTRPTQGTFGIHDAQIIAPGDPFRSVLYFRMATVGGGRMPHIGSSLVDQRGLALVQDWIRQLPEIALGEQLTALDEPMALAREKAGRLKTLRRLARNIAVQDGRVKPSDEDRRQARRQAAEAVEKRVKQRANDRARLIDDCLSNTSRALTLARLSAGGHLPPTIRDQVIQTAVKSSEAQVRDLFEQFLPPHQRSQRLGQVIRPAEILALTGDRGRGERLFWKAANVNCRNCHCVGEVGTRLGPDLTAIGKTFNRNQLLESIVEPSKNIDPKYTTWLVETNEGRVHVGLLVEKANATVVLRDARNELIQLAADEVEVMVPQRQSLMPELLLRDMTAEQVADLLAYLESLR